MKKKRHEMILNLIKENEISTQDELLELLIQNGFSVTQATVSRDINELNLVKGAGTGKKFKYVKGFVANGSVSQKYIELFKQVSISLTSANNLIVVKTLSGNAGAAGMAIDEMRFTEILGTIAGDDTLLIITKNNADADVLIKKLRNI